VLVNMDEGRKRLEHIRRELRVSITVLAADDWNRHVTLLGRSRRSSRIRSSRGSTACRVITPAGHIQTETVQG
jgi:hypothetical protein